MEIAKKGFVLKEDKVSNEKIGWKCLRTVPMPNGIMSSEINLSEYKILKDNLKKGERINSNMLTVSNTFKQFKDIVQRVEELRLYSLDIGKKLCILLLSTRGHEKQNWYLGGIRRTDKFIALSIINLNNRLRILKEFLSTNSDFIIID